MMSLRLAALLSVVSIFRNTSAEIVKCDKSFVKYGPNGGGIIETVIANQETTCDGACYTEVFLRFIKQDVEIYNDCMPGKNLTEAYFCDDKSIGWRKDGYHMFCYCVNSGCNTPEVFFDHDGDAGQKERSVQLLRGIGVIVQFSTQTGKRVIDFKSFSCEEWRVFRQLSGVHQFSRITYGMVWKGNCLRKIDRLALDKLNWSSQFWKSIVLPACYVHDDPIKPSIKCICPGSGCYDEASFFDPEGDAGQKNRAAVLREIGIIAEVNTTATGRIVEFNLDNYGKNLTEESAENANDVHDGDKDAAVGLSLASPVFLTAFVVIR